MNRKDSLHFKLCGNIYAVELPEIALMDCVRQH